MEDEKCPFETIWNNHIIIAIALWVEFPCNLRYTYIDIMESSYNGLQLLADFTILL